MHPRALAHDHAQQPQLVVVLVPQLQMSDHEQVLERRVLSEPAHPLETDPGLIFAGRADRDAPVRDGQQVV